MPVLASGGPRAHPNADYAGLPPYLTPPPPVKISNMAWPPSELASGNPMYAADRELRVVRVMSSNLNSAIGMLSRSNGSIRDLIRQHESAWMALRVLYNHVVILQKLLERLRDMFIHLPHVESVAKDVNVYDPESLHDATKEKHKKKSKYTSHGSSSSSAYLAPTPPTQQTPFTWSNRVLPKVEQMMIEVRGCLVDLESACRSAVLRRQSRLLQDPDTMPLRWGDSYIYTTARKLHSYEHQLESYMTTCKYIHMVSTETLYKNRDGLHLDESDTYYYLDDGSSEKDRPAFYSFWSSMSLAKAAKKRLQKEKKEHKKKQAAEEHGLAVPQSPSSRSSKSTKKQQAKGKTKEEWTQAAASKEDLLAAIDRKDYLTVVTMLMSDMTLNDMLEDGTFVLSHAVDDDNSALVSILAMCGADANVRHSSGNTPLHFASNTNCVAPALLLLEIGAQVDVRDAHGLTPLHVACRERNLGIILQLLAHGADPNVCDNRGLTPLSYALMRPKRPTPSREILTALLTYGARATGRGLVLPPFVEAIFRYDSALMCRLLQTHPDAAEAEMSVATTGPDGGVVRLRPLCAAILVGNIYAIDQLLRHGADVHHVTSAYGKTTTYLDLAVHGDSTSIMARLLLANADPNVANANGRTPLQLAAAASHGEVEIVELLLRHGADVHAQTHDRHSQALHMAVRVGRADMCFHLLKRGAEIDRPLRSGVTPIMLAVYYNNKSMLRFLIGSGGDVRYKTPMYGETAMHTACRIGSVSLAIILQQQGLSVNAENPFLPPGATSAKADGSSSGHASNSNSDSDTDTDTDNNDAVEESDKVGKGKMTSSTPTATERARSGYAPIHAAASRGHIEMVRWLLANGADPTARIGRVASLVCLGKDKARNRSKAREKEKEGNSAKSVSYAKHDVSTEDVDDAATVTANDVNSNDYADDYDSDPGETPVEVARAFGHERTAGLIEDAIIAASPEATQYLTPSQFTSSSSGSSGSSADRPPPPPDISSHKSHPLTTGKPSSRYSLDPVYDSGDEGEALAGELRKSKKKASSAALEPPTSSAPPEPPAPPADSTSDGDVDDQDPSDLTE